MTTGAKPARHARTSTGEKLVRAAAREFNEHGFLGTDTNRIARRAGFAPQTFYRWFGDKTEIFIKVYEQWQRDAPSEASHIPAQPASVVARRRRRPQGPRGKPVEPDRADQSLESPAAGQY